MNLIIPRDECRKRLNIYSEKQSKFNKELLRLKNKPTDSKIRLEEEITALDEQIDQEVYKLYGLTKEEMKIVEESLA